MAGFDVFCQALGQRQEGMGGPQIAVIKTGQEAEAPGIVRGVGSKKDQAGQVGGPAAEMEGPERRGEDVG